MYRQQGKQPPIDHVDKTQFPLILLCMIRMVTLYRFLPHNPYPLHDLSFCHSSKQTTILADIGVVCDHVAPATVTAYYACLVATVLMMMMSCESGW